LGIPPDGESGTKKHAADLARAVMRYLGEHPQAMDNVEGIAEWWVMCQPFHVDVDTLAQVLRQLADEGRLERVDSAKGPLYRLRR
jgi:hypothetical protein